MQTLKGTPSLTVNLSHLEKNFRTLRTQAGRELIAVVKANAYGHGAVQCAEHLIRAGARHLAVASAREALPLLPLFKRQKCNENFTYEDSALWILGPVHPSELRTLLPYRVVLSVHSLCYAKRLSAALDALGEGLKMSVALKLETGMHRLGIETAKEALCVSHLPHLSPYSLYSHLAEANGPPNGRTLGQISSFLRLSRPILREHPHLLTHLSASGGIRSGISVGTHARAGLALYGVGDTSLLPVGCLSASVLTVKRVHRGAGVGYGGFRIGHDTRIAVLGIGYADGLPPSLSGAHIPLKSGVGTVVGELCMDRTLLDIGEAPLREGSRVVLFGKRRGDLEALAREAGVSPYVLLSVRSERTERVYVSS